MTQAQPPPMASDVSPLRRWKWRCFVLTAVYGSQLVFMGYISLILEPRFEAIFEEMIGPHPRLPADTQFVIAVSRFLQGNLIFIGLSFSSSRSYYGGLVGKGCWPPR
jgi:hypothetical protein